MANELTHKNPGTQLTQDEYRATDGTGHLLDSQATGDILYASSSTVLKGLAIGSTGAVLTVTGGIPAWDTTWTPTGHLIPATDDSYDLGSSSAAWQDLFLEGDITLTDAGTLATSAGALTITSAAAATWSTSAGALTITSAAALNLNPTAGSAIVLDGIINVDAGVVTGATSITSTAFVGDITGDVSGNVTGNVSGTAATVTTAAQSNITSLGTLTTLTVDNIIINGTNIGHTSDTDAIAIASDGVVTMNQIPVFSAGINVSGGSIAGTLSTAAQANITSLGTLTALTVDDVAVDGKVITMTGSANDTAVFTAGTNGTLSIVTSDAGDSSANIQVTADGTVDIDSAGVLTLDSGAAINIEPASGSAILLDGTISIDAGVVTGATSITSTAFVGDITGDVTGNADTATLATTVTITDNESTSETNAVIFTAGGDVDGGNLGLESDGDFTYNPSSGTASATTFSGALSGNATTATALATGRTIAMTGDVAWTSASFDGSGNVTGAGTIQANAVEGSMLNTDVISGQTEISSGLAAADELLYSDAGTLKKVGVDTLTTYLAGVNAGTVTSTGISDSSGVLTLDIQNMTASSTIADADLLVIDDGAGGTLRKMTRANFIESAALDSINIDGGAIDGITLGTNSAVTQAVIDNININGTTIGHTDDTDLMTLADGVLSVAGTLDVTGSLEVATIDYQDGDLAMTIADGGGVTFAQDITTTSHKYINLPENSSIKFTDQIGVDNSIDNDDGQGIIFTFRAGATVTPFSPVYLDGNNEAQECNANAIATMPCIGVSMNTSNVSADADLEVMMLGLIRHDSFGDFGAAGAPVYVSTTVGTMTTTAPTGEDDVVQIVGHSIAEDLIFVQPCLTTIEHAA